MTSKIIRFLGSIRLAVPLLAAIAAILIGATFYESVVGSATVQREIYKSVWFGGLMFLLAVNLGISTLSRFPWRGPRKIGFALTHWGLVIIIAGSAAVIHLSTEGMLLVRTDGVPNAEIRVEGDVLEVVAPGQFPEQFPEQRQQQQQSQRQQRQQQSDIFIRSDGSVYPREFAGLSLLGYSDRAIKTVSFTNGGAVQNLAVQIQLHSDRMGQTLRRWLAAAPMGYRQMDLGPAHLELLQANSEAELAQLLSPSEPVHATYGELRLGDKVIDVEQSLGKSVRLDQGLTVKVVDVWPDFRLGPDNQPTSNSDQFRNPAIQLNLQQGTAQARWFVFAQNSFDPIRSGDDISLAVAYEAPQPTATDYFHIIAGPDHQLFYAARSSRGLTTGELHLGDPVTPGWADFQISLVQQLDQAQVQRQVVPMTPVAASAMPTMSKEGRPALQVATADGQETWLPWGEPTVLPTPDGDYFVAFSPKLLQLPFYVKLNNFIVERNEGSESVAMWTSDVTLFDPITDTAVRRSVWMNHPTWFRGWKLAQASWNPGDLQQSTLQLKREPWWVTALTWTGSLLVVLGIGVMFYGPGLIKKVRRWTGGHSPAAPGSMDDSVLDDPVVEKRPVIPILAVFGK